MRMVELDGKRFVDWLSARLIPSRRSTTPDPARNPPSKPANIPRMGESDKPTIPDVISHPASAPSRSTHPLLNPLDPISLNYLLIAGVAAAGISWLPSEVDADGYRVPTVIFRGQPWSFQVFVMLIVCLVSTSHSGLYSYDCPKLGRFLRSCSAVFLSSAAAVLLYALCRCATG